MPGWTFRPSSLFPLGLPPPSCRPVRGKTAQFQVGRTAAKRACLFKYGDEHRRDILQEIFRVRALEKFGVLLQLVRHLINDETAAGRERVMRFLQERAFLVDLEDAERDAGKDVIAMRETAAREFLWQPGRVSVHHMDAPIAGK